MTLRPLSELDIAGIPAGRPLRVCIVSLLGAAHNGGIGTATNAMSRHIALDGHEVTLLYSLVEYGAPVNVAHVGDTRSGLRTWKDWTDALAADGVRLELLDHQGSHESWLEKSWHIKEFLARRQFDVVYFDEWHGGGYYSLLAKRAGLAPFVDQVHVVFTHSSKQWVCVSNDEYLSRVYDLTVLGMERRCVEMADVVLSPSRHLLEEYDRYGWALPDQCYHHPLSLLRGPVPVPPAPQPIGEIVFFGRLEVRKGLWLFCDALERLGDRLKGKTVTFMGPLTAPFGTSSGMQLLARSVQWPFRVQIFTDHDRRAAQRYMAEGRRLAVMPSLEDNSPCVVYECMEAGIPFVTTSAGGAKELIAPDCLPETVVAPTVAAQADRLETALVKGVRPVTPGFSPTEALDTWTGWLRLLARDPAASRAPVPAATQATLTETPLIVILDGARGPVSALLENVGAMVRRLGGTARFLVLSDRRHEAQAIVATLLVGIGGGALQVLDPDDMAEARDIISAAEAAFFVDADTEILTPFFILALGLLGRPDPGLVSCIGARRAEGAQTEPQIDLFPAADVPGLAALGHVVGGPVWAFSPRKMPGVFDRLPLHDARHDELIDAWTSGETMARLCGGDSLTLLPVVGALMPAADPARPLRTAQRLRAGATQQGLGTSLHLGRAAWFAIDTFGTRSPQPAGALTLRLPEARMAEPHLNMLAMAEADLALQAALFGRPDLALQIEAGRPTSTGRVQHLIDLAVETALLRPSIDLLGVLAQSAVAPQDDSEPQAGVSAFLDPRVTYADGRLLSHGSTRIGGPATVLLVDVPLAGHTGFEMRVRSLAFQPLLLRVRLVDQDSGDMIGTSEMRLGLRDIGTTHVALPRFHGPIAVALDISGADRFELALDTLIVLAA